MHMAKMKWHGIIKVLEIWTFCDRWKIYESYEFDENVWKKYEFSERFEKDLNLVRGLNSFVVVLLQVVGVLLQVIML
jgi:hypothetical protein